MKTFGIVMVIFLLPFLALAQGKLKPMDEALTPPAQTYNSDPNAPIIQKHQATPVVQSIGKVYNEEELTRMSRREVNTVAGTIAGVDSRPGTNETPNIRGGGASGTAYYVDGVRIYGAKPVITK